MTTAEDVYRDHPEPEEIAALIGEGQEMRWIDRAIGSSTRIREIIGRMTRITRIESASSMPGIPAMLDIHRSSEDN